MILGKFFEFLREDEAILTTAELTVLISITVVVAAGVLMYLAPKVTEKFKTIGNELSGGEANS